MVAWALLGALLPSLLYLGHWAFPVPIPGMDAYIALGMRAEHEAQREEGGHERHCHGDASCTDVPPSPVNGFAVLNDTLGLLGAGGLLVLAAALAWQPATGPGKRPLVPPPRAFALS